MSPEPGLPPDLAPDLAPDLDPERIRGALADRAPRIGRRLDAHASVGSTMDLAAAAARAGEEEGLVVLADVQRAGRGRLGRPWETPSRAALALSILFRPPLRPPLDAERLPQVPMAVGLGALEGLADHAPAAARLGLKWPNDLLLDGAKLGGLLAEIHAGRDGAPPALVVGLGLNVNASPPDLGPAATCLAAAWQDPDGHHGPRPALARDRLAADLLAAVDRRYAELLGGADLVPDWAARLETLGKDVAARPGPGLAGETVRGRAVGVTEDGALLVETAAGARVAVRAGDVTLRGERGG